MENSNSDFDCTTSTPSMSSRENLLWDSSDSLSRCPCANCCHFTRHRRQRSFVVCSSCSRLTSCSSCPSSESTASTDRQTPPGGVRVLDDDKTESDTKSSYNDGDDDTFKSLITKEQKASSNNNAAPCFCHCRRSFRCPQQRSRSSSSTTTSWSLGWDSATLVRSISSLTDHIADDRFFSEFYCSDDASVSSAVIPEQCQHRQVARRLERCPSAPRSRSADAVKRSPHQLLEQSRDVQEMDSSVSHSSSSVRFCQIVKTLYRDKTYTCLSTLTAQENADVCKSECKSRSYIVLSSNNSNTVFFDRCLPLDSTVKRKEWRIDGSRLPRDDVGTIHFCRDCRDKTLCRPFEHRDRRGDEVFFRNQNVRWSKKVDGMDSDHLRRRQSPQTMNRSGTISDRRPSDASVSSSDSDHIRHLTLLRNPCSEQSHCPRRYVDTCTITADESKDDICDFRCSTTSVSFNDEENQFDCFEETEVISESESAESELLFSDELYVEIITELFEYPEIIQPLKCFLGKASIPTEVDLESPHSSSLVFGFGPLSELESEKITLDTLCPIQSTTQFDSNATCETNFRTPLRGRRKSIRLMWQLTPALTVYTGCSPIPGDSDKLHKVNVTIVANDLERPSITTTSVERMAIVLREPSMETLDSKEFQSIEPYMEAHLVTNAYDTATIMVHLQDSLPDAQSIASIEPVYAETSEVPSLVNAVVVDNSSAVSEKDISAATSMHLLFANQENLPEEQMNNIASIEPVYAATSEVDDLSLVNAVAIDNYSMGFEKVVSSPDKWSDLNDRTYVSIEPVYAETREMDDLSLVNVVVIDNTPVALGRVMSSSDKWSDSFERVTDVAVPVVSTRLRQRAHSNPFGLTIGYFTPHPERHLIPTEKDRPVFKLSNNKAKEVVASEDLDIPAESFTSASKIWTLSSDFGGNHLEQTPGPSESPKTSKPDEKADPNPSCFKELLVLAKKDQKTPPSTACRTPPSTACSETPVGQGDLPCPLLPDSVFGRRKIIRTLNNAIAQNYTWSAVTHLLSRPADSDTSAEYRCAFHDSHDRRMQRCKCLRRLSRKTICKDQTADSKFDQINFLEDSTNRSKLSSMSSTLTRCRTRPDSHISNDCSCHYPDLMLSEAVGESEETDTITTIYTRLPASLHLRPPALPHCPLLPESHIPSRSGRQMTSAAELDANCNQSDDIISSTIIASRKRHRKREVFDDTGKQSREKYYERKYKTLKHFCVREFGRTKALLETLQRDDE